MAKYINSERHKIILLVNKDLQAINPGETFESNGLIPELHKYIVEDIPDTAPKKSRGKINGSKT